MKKSTAELLKTLKHTTNISTYLSQEQENLQALPLHLYLDKMFAEKKSPPASASAIQAQIEPIATRFSPAGSFPPGTKSSLYVLDCRWITNKPSFCSKPPGTRSYIPEINVIVLLSLPYSEISLLQKQTNFFWIWDMRFFIKNPYKQTRKKRLPTPCNLSLYTLTFFVTVQNP